MQGQIHYFEYEKYLITDITIIISQIKTANGFFLLLQYFEILHFCLVSVLIPTQCPRNSNYAFAPRLGFFSLMFLLWKIFNLGVGFVVLSKKILYEAAPHSVSHQYDKVENT